MSNQPLKPLFEALNDAIKAAEEEKLSPEALKKLRLASANLSARLKPEAYFAPPDLEKYNEALELMKKRASELPVVF